MGLHAWSSEFRRVDVEASVAEELHSCANDGVSTGYSACKLQRASCICLARSDPERNVAPTQAHVL